MKRLIIFLVLFGILGILSAVSGVSSFSGGASASTHGTSIGYHIGHHSSLFSRIAAAGSGIVMLLFAWGIHRRFKPVWILMFLAMGYSWICGSISASTATAANYPHQSHRDTLLLTGLIFLVSGAVVSFWGFRWYKQKEYFYGERAK